MAGKYMEIGVPEKIKISRNFQQLRITRKWFEFKYIIFTVFVILMCSGIFSWYAVDFPYSIQNMFTIDSILISLVQGTVIIGLTYYVLAGYINKTTIDVDFNSVSVRQGPLPYLGNKRIPSKMITQLYCKRDVYSLSRSRYPAFVVRAITTDRRNIKLISGLETSEQALFIEQEIEKFLNIEDKPVKGEIR